MHKACNEWEDILVEYPNDLMAIKFAHTGYFYIGDNLGFFIICERSEERRVGKECA